MDEVRRVQFPASFPLIQSAISVSGAGDGARIKLDIPQSHADVIPLLQMYFTGRAFLVTCELLDDEPDGNAHG